ncbi:glycosyltransferase family 2 protein [Flavobacterium johnsoniae]|uniref:glycosyltransferase family 2 protein n=1 Tax=Flavobacterium johnsoniae TaxID=986 RepID=UPI003201418D
MDKFNKEPLVYILLASYNGGKYIEEQINSIVLQTYTNWILLIRDDNSSDDTVTIIESFIRKDQRIKLIEKGVENNSKGACQNFASLLNVAVQEKASYMMFADQDDYWFPEKIDKMIKGIDKDLNPAMLYSSFLYADDNLKILPEHVQKIKSSFLKPSFNRLIVQNTVYGCTMMINYSMAQKCLPIPQEAENHDYWITLVATGINASISHLDIPLMLYRQHGNNVTGSFNDHSNFSRVKRFFTGWSNMKKVQLKKNKMLDIFAKKMKSELLPQNLELIEGYLKWIKYNNIQLIIFCVANGIKRFSFLSTIVFYFTLCSLPKTRQIS